MEWGTDDRVTVADVLARFEISESTLTRRRKAGALPSAERSGPGKRWTFTASEVTAQGWRVRASPSDPSPSSHDEQSEPVTLTSQKAIELGELRSTMQAQNADLERITAERDRARSDHEHERTRADAAEREALAQRTRADGLTEQRNDLATRLDRLTDSVLGRLDSLEARSAEQSSVDAAGLLSSAPNPPSSPSPEAADDQGLWNRFWTELRQGFQPD